MDDEIIATNANRTTAPAPAAAPEIPTEPVQLLNPPEAPGPATNPSGLEIALSTPNWVMPSGTTDSFNGVGFADIRYAPEEPFYPVPAPRDNGGTDFNGFKFDNVRVGFGNFSFGLGEITLDDEGLSGPTPTPVARTGTASWNLGENGGVSWSWRW